MGRYPCIWSTWQFQPVSEDWKTSKIARLSFFFESELQLRWRFHKWTTVVCRWGLATWQALMGLEPWFFETSTCSHTMFISVAEREKRESNDGNEWGMMVDVYVNYDKLRELIEIGWTYSVAMCWVVKVWQKSQQEAKVGSFFPVLSTIPIVQRQVGLPKSKIRWFVACWFEYFENYPLGCFAIRLYMDLRSWNWR